MINIEKNRNENKKTKVKETKRQMNFELLRIVSMVMIILHHYSLKGGLLDIEIISGNKFLGEFIYIGGKVGTIIFVLISGYFLVNSRYKIKNLIKTILEVQFYSISIYIILVITNQIGFSFKDLIKSILPISYNQYWFATSYIGMYIFVPFINKLIINLSKEQYQLLIAIGMITFVIMPTFIVGGGDSFIGGISYFIYLYAVAGYLKKYDISILNTRKKCVCLIIIITLIMMTVSIISTYLSMHIDAFKKGITYLANQNSIFTVLLSLGIFQVFRFIDIKYNIIIEKCAKACFAVYLIHENKYFAEILWKNILKTNSFYYVNVFVLVLHIIGAVIGIYTCALLVEMFRKKIIEKNFESFYDRYIVKKIETIENILNM